MIEQINHIHIFIDHCRHLITLFLVENCQFIENHLFGARFFCNLNCFLPLHFFQFTIYFRFHTVLLLFYDNPLFCPTSLYFCHDDRTTMVVCLTSATSSDMVNLHFSVTWVPYSHHLPIWSNFGKAFAYVLLWSFHFYSIFYFDRK